MGKRQAASSRPNARAIKQNDVAYAREIACDEGFADAPAPRKERHHNDFNGRRIPVIQGLDESSLLERARHRVQVREMLQAVGQVDRSDPDAQCGVGRQTVATFAVNRYERSVLSPQRYVNARTQTRSDAGIG